MVFFEKKKKEGCVAAGLQVFFWEKMIRNRDGKKRKEDLVWRYDKYMTACLQNSQAMTATLLFMQLWYLKHFLKKRKKTISGLILTQFGMFS